MELELDEENSLFRDMTRKWVEREFPKQWCREAERQEHQFPQRLWDKLTEFGAHGIGIGEEYGGQGGSILTQAVFARELARTTAGLGWVWGLHPSPAANRFPSADRSSRSSVSCRK
jgi:acyl-CoA dehydrogenase